MATKGNGLDRLNIGKANTALGAKRNNNQSVLHGEQTSCKWFEKIVSRLSFVEERMYIS